MIWLQARAIGNFCSDTFIWKFQPILFARNFLTYIICIRYRVIDLLGQGSFGQAAKCLDETTGEYVAVKIVKSLPAYHNQALVEVKLLQMVCSAKIIAICAIVN